MKRARVLSVCFGGTALVLLGIGGTNQTHSAYYCQVCGMKRAQNKREWFGLPYQDTNHIYPTGYSELYFRGVSGSCAHQWVFVGSRSTGNVLTGGENGDGTASYVLRYAPVLHRLRNLDVERIPCVLAALPLKPGLASEPERRTVDDIFDALTELNSQPTKQQTELWWRKHHNLFNHSGLIQDDLRLQN